MSRRAAAEAAPAAGQARPSAPAAGRAPSLRVLGQRQLAARRRRRQARALVVLSAAVLGGGLLTVAAAQAVVDSQQVRLDKLAQQVGAAVTQNQGLQLQHADLSSPSRLLQVAEHQLGMVVPRSVTYLSALPAPTAGTGSAATGQTASSSAGRPVTSAGTAAGGVAAEAGAGRASVLHAARRSSGRG